MTGQITGVPMKPAFRGAPLIPRKVLFGNPDKAGVQISPDGKYISYLAPVNGVLNVWVAPATDHAAAQPVTQDTKRGIRFYFWSFLADHLLYIQDEAGDENWHLYSVNVAQKTTRDLTPIAGVYAQVQQLSRKHPGEALIGLNDRVPQLHDVYRVDLRTGERTPVVQNDGFAGYVTDDEFNIRFGAKMHPDGSLHLLRHAGEGKWEPYIIVPSEDVLTTNIIDFDKTGRILHLTDSRGRDTSALFALDTETGQQTLLAEDPRADVSGTMLHPTERHIQAVAFTYERKEWRILDQAIADDLTYLKTVADGEVEVSSRTLDDTWWVVSYVIDAGPVRYYLYDRAAKTATYLFSNRAALEGLLLAKMHPVVIPARDGLKLVSYYTLPVGSDTRTPGKPDQPLPMVLFVHGGPWVRDEWGFSPWHQWLANRGYAVLSVNYRASTGFGKGFTNAGDLETGRKIHNDLIDGVEWAIREGIAAPDRVAIMGGSYGGYATLAGLTLTPDRFACGVDIVGPSNLITLLESIPPYWEPQIALLRTRIGDNTTEEGRKLLTERSPLTYVDRIKRPLLIAQGANDPRVKRAESDQIVKAMQDKGIPVTYVLYPDEGHGFARPENSLSFTAIAEAFLAAHLEGEYEPIGEDFAGASVEILTGIEGIPGAAETLSTRQVKES